MEKLEQMIKKTRAITSALASDECTIYEPAKKILQEIYTGSLKYYSTRYLAATALKIPAEKFNANLSDWLESLRLELQANEIKREQIDFCKENCGIDHCSISLQCPINSPRANYRIEKRPDKTKRLEAIEDAISLFDLSHYSLLEKTLREESKTNIPEVKEKLIIYFLEVSRGIKRGELQVRLPYLVLEIEKELKATCTEEKRVKSDFFYGENGSRYPFSREYDTVEVEVPEVETRLKAIEDLLSLYRIYKTNQIRGLLEKQFKEYQCEEVTSRIFSEFPEIKPKPVEVKVNYYPPVRNNVKPLRGILSLFKFH